MRWAARSVVVLVTALAAAPVAQAADISVTTTADGLANDGACSLREAVSAARLDLPVLGCPAGAAGVDTILLGPGTYDLDPPAGGGTEDGNQSGDLDTGPTAIRVAGRGAGVTVIDALRGDRAFDVFQGASLTLDSLTIRRGRAAQGSPGGAIRNQGALTVVRSSFEENAAGSGRPSEDGGVVNESGGAGGAIWSSGPAPPSVVVVDSLFSGNAAGTGGEGLSFTGSASSGGGFGGNGGAIAFESGTGAVSGSTFTGNRAGTGGAGGIRNGERIVGGDGGSGGAVAVAGGADVTVLNSTFAGNAAGPKGEGVSFQGGRGVDGSGGAADLDLGNLRITWSTFAGNVRGGPSAAGGNGLYGGQVGASILADAAPACAEVSATLRNVTLPGETGCGQLALPGDPRLGPLAANGGSTPTLLPGVRSAAIDALAGAACPPTDQRGSPRPQLGGCDAGAVEVQPGPPALVPAAGPRRAGSVTGLRLSPSSFRAAGSGGSIGPAPKSLLARAPIGTTVAYRLDGVAKVTFTVARTSAGRRRGKRCVTPAAATPGARRCVRTQRLKGSFARQGGVGQNSFRFTGRLRRRALAPGPYTLVARLPTPATGRGATTTRAFRIVP